MAQIINLNRPHCAPAPVTSPVRLPLKAAVALAFVLGMVALSTVVPQTEIAPDMAWRGNSGSLEMIR